jgi:phospholipid/cholesterol/gamma-HCH transport system permease protein
MEGGALGVGKASTTSFIWTSVSIIIANSLITNILLT